MKIEPLSTSDLRLARLSVGNDYGDTEIVSQAVARAAQADALRQVIEEAKRTSTIIETSPNDYEVDVSRAYKFFKSLQYLKRTTIATTVTTGG